jgi:hypothetical protein
MATQLDAQLAQRLRRSPSTPAEFDTEWDYGWKRAEPMLLQYQSLRLDDPQDYESQLRERWARRNKGRNPGR